MEESARHIETTAVALVFCACHVLAPRAFRLQERARHAVGSFSGGLAAAYVFLHLLPEIGEGGELLGPRIYFVLLVGLAVYYVVEVCIHRLRARGAVRWADEALHLGTSGLYNAMIVFTLGEQLPGTSALTLVFGITVGLHLISSDFGLQEEYAERFVARGRWVLVAAVAFGYALSLVREPHEEMIDLLTALLAGLMLFKVFRKELPDFGEARLSPFLIGMGVFLVGHLLLSAGE